jgi:hypothetical protein
MFQVHKIGSNESVNNTWSAMHIGMSRDFLFFSCPLSFQTPKIILTIDAFCFPGSQMLCHSAQEI